MKQIASKFVQWDVPRIGEAERQQGLQVTGTS